MILASCESKTEREIEVDKIKDQSTEIILKIKNEMDNSEALNKVVWKTNMDSIRDNWYRIYQDSAELSLIYLKKFDSLYNTKTSQLREIEKIAKEKRLAESKQKLEKLKRKFMYKEDEFEKIGFYTHKRWGNYWPNRKTLTSGVNSSGYAWLRSNYSADDWLFHTSIYVLIGERRLVSPTVPTYDPKNITDNKGGRIWEVVTYSDTEILREIAENTDKVIKVRFNGSEFYDDTTLSSADKQALKECYELSQLLKL